MSIPDAQTQTGPAGGNDVAVTRFVQIAAPLSCLSAERQAMFGALLPATVSRLANNISPPDSVSTNEAVQRAFDLAGLFGMLECCEASLLTREWPIVRQLATIYASLQLPDKTPGRRCSNDLRDVVGGLTECSPRSPVQSRFNTIIEDLSLPLLGHRALVIVAAKLILADGCFAGRAAPHGALARHVGDSGPLKPHQESTPKPDKTGLPTVNPIFTWVRLAQRVPVRINIDQIPEGVKLFVGATATVQIDPSPGQ